MIRITADIDNKRKVVALYYFFKAMWIIKRVKKIELMKSYSGNHHLIVWTTHKYKKWEQYRLRKRIGDDPHRLAMDRIRQFGKNTLFQRKEAFHETDLV